MTEIPQVDAIQVIETETHNITNEAIARAFRTRFESAITKAVNDVLAEAISAAAAAPTTQLEGRRLANVLSSNELDQKIDKAIQNALRDTANATSNGAPISPNIDIRTL